MRTFRFLLPGAISVGLLAGQVNVLTWHNDAGRTGQNLSETILTPANVNSSTFGKLFTIPVDGKVDAQPLYAGALSISGGTHNVLYVVTEHDSAYAFDADTGAQLWKTTFLKTGESPSDDRGCGQVTPEIGSTATPAIDLHRGPHGTLYAVAMSKDGSGHYYQRIHALDLTTGAEQFSGPVDIQATYPGTGANSSNGTVTFDPKQYKERPGLLILNGVVYTTWGSHCDDPPYTGWVMGYSESGLQQVSVLDLIPNGNDGGIWGSGAGPAADAGGNIYLLTGNGTFDTRLNGSGFPNQNDFGNAIVKISTAGGSLAVADYFTMSNSTSESASDTDFGSGGLMLLPSLAGSGGPVSLAVGAGKDGNIYVVNQQNLGKFATPDMIYQQISGALPGGAWSSPAWFNGTLYYGDVGDNLQAFAFTGGAFTSVASSRSGNSFPYPGATPSISADGTSNAIVWAVENSSPAVLHAYDAADLSNELYNSNQASKSRDHFGSGNKFIVPTIANGKVYVGTTNSVGVFGLLNGGTSPGAPPSPVSVSPNSGSAATAVLSATYSDAGGAGAIALAYLMVGSSISGPDSCFVEYNTASKSFRLLNDAGSAWSSPIKAGSGKAKNSQCTFLGKGASGAASGTNLTVNIPLTFASTYSGAKNVYLLAIDQSGQNSGWQQLGMWTVPGSGGGGSGGGGTSGSGVPVCNPQGACVASLMPATGSGTSGTFTGTFTDTNGANQLYLAYLLFLPTPNVVQYTAAGSCLVEYNRISNAVRLINDAGNNWLPGVSGTPLTAGGTLSNSHCTLNVGLSSVQINGNTLTLAAALTFSSNFTGTLATFLQAFDVNGAYTGLTQFGNWIATAGSPKPGPYVAGVSPTSGTGSSATLAISAGDSKGVSALSFMTVLISQAIVGAGACQAFYFPAANTLNLVNDAGTAMVSETGIAPGTAGTLANSRCSIDTGSASRTLAGNTVTVNLPVTFITGTFSGAQSIYVNAFDQSGLTTDWVSGANWTIQ